MKIIIFPTIHHIPSCMPPSSIVLRAHHAEQVGQYMFTPILRPEVRTAKRIGTWSGHECAAQNVHRKLDYCMSIMSPELHNYFWRCSDTAKQRYNMVLDVEGNQQTRSERKVSHDIVIALV